MLARCLSRLARSTPDSHIFELLASECDSNYNFEHITTSQLLKASFQVASQLSKGKTACIVYNESCIYEFIVFLVACSISGTVLILLPPLQQRHQSAISRIKGVLHMHNLDAVFTSASLAPSLRAKLDLTVNVLDSTHHSSKGIELARVCNEIESHDVDIDECALIQFTSGTTSHPIPIHVSHRQLGLAALQIHALMGLTDDFTGVTWLPLCHDMGFIGHVVAPICLGFTSVIIPTSLFLLNPSIWLHVISSQYPQKVVSGGPDFAFRLLCHNINGGSKRSYNLSHWSIAYSGAECIQPQTLIQTHRQLQHFGFKPQALYTCYGLAEAVLQTSGGHLCLSDSGDILHMCSLPCATISNEPRVSTTGLHPKTEEMLLRTGLQEHRAALAAWSTRLLHMHAGHMHSELRHQPNCCSTGVLGPFTVGRVDEDGQLRLTGPLCAATDDTGAVCTHDDAIICNEQLYVLGRQSEKITSGGQTVYASAVEHGIEGKLQEYIRLTRTVCVSASVEVVSELLQSQKVLSSELGHTARLLDGNVLCVITELNRRVEPTPDCLERVCNEIAAACWGGFRLHVGVCVIASAGSVLKTTSGKRQRWATFNSLLSHPGRVISMQCMPSTSVPELLHSSFVTPPELGLSSLDVVRLCGVINTSAQSVTAMTPQALCDYRFPQLIFHDGMRPPEVESTIVQFVVAQLLQKRATTNAVTDLVTEVDAYVHHQTAQARAAAEQVLPSPMQPGSSVKRGVLVLGAAGYVGAFVCAALMRLPQCEVYALTRADSDDHALARVKHQMKRYDLHCTDGCITGVRGDVTAPNLGLSTDTLARLSSCTHTVINCSGVDNFIAPYAELAAVNVASLVHIADFCRLASVQLCVHLSSCTAILHAASPHLQPSAGLINGYSISKAVAEVLFRQLCDTFTGVILRLPLLYDTTAAPSEANDLLESFVLTVYELQQLPALHNASIPLADVATVAKGIADLSHASLIGAFNGSDPIDALSVDGFTLASLLHEELYPSRTACRTFFPGCLRVVQCHQLLRCVSDRLRINEAECVPLQEWIECAQKHSRCCHMLITQLLSQELMLQCDQLTAQFTGAGVGQYMTDSEAAAVVSAALPFTAESDSPHPVQSSE